jgi:hypothetical protein
MEELSKSYSTGLSWSYGKSRGGVKKGFCDDGFLVSGLWEASGKVILNCSKTGWDWVEIRP